MLIEELIILIFGSTALLIIGLPIYRFVSNLNLSKQDPLREAKIRLEIAKKEAEAAKLNREAEHIYDDMYKEVLDDSNDSHNDEKRRV